jgi:hypothetical protein
MCFAECGWWSRTAKLVTFCGLTAPVQGAPIVVENRVWRMLLPLDTVDFIGKTAALLDVPISVPMLRESMEFAETITGIAPIGSVPGKHEGRNRRIRSAVTNGTRAFVVGDGNSPWARRQRDLLDQYISDQGGSDVVSTVAYSLCRLAASLGTEREIMEGKLSLGLPVDLDQFGRIAGHERRVLETLGLARKQRDVSTSAVLEHFKRPVRRAP